jgi:hypothetical protein
MNQEDTDKNRAEKVQLKIPIPALNEYLLKDMKRWAKNAYAHARRQVDWKKAKKIKGIMPIETAAYAEDKVFGNWRLVAPDGPDKISPLQQVITLIRDEIVPTRWGEFRRNFVREIKIDFNAICESDYDPKMVDEVNQRLNQLVSQYEHTVGRVKLNFVLEPETAEFYSSERLLGIRSRIWERFTGKPLDLSIFRNPTAAGRQMAMFLVLTCLRADTHRQRCIN